MDSKSKCCTLWVKTQALNDTIYTTFIKGPENLWTEITECGKKFSTFIEVEFNSEKKFVILKCMFRGNFFVKLTKDKGYISSSVENWPINYFCKGEFRSCRCCK